MWEHPSDKARNAATADHLIWATTLLGAMLGEARLWPVLQYAQWEESQKDFRRARSVWERTIDVNYQSEGVWVKYAEMEMRHRFVNHARNVWDRAVTLLPRIDKLWYKYIHMEEMLGNVPGARQIFQRWINFEPDHPPWMAYINVSPAWLVTWLRHHADGGPTDFIR